MSDLIKDSKTFLPNIFYDTQIDVAIQSFIKNYRDTYSGFEAFKGNFNVDNIDIYIANNFIGKSLYIPFTDPNDLGKIKQQLDAVIYAYLNPCTYNSIQYLYYAYMQSYIEIQSPSPGYIKIIGAGTTSDDIEVLSAVLVTFDYYALINGDNKAIIVSDFFNDKGAIISTWLKGFFPCNIYLEFTNQSISFNVLGNEKSKTIYNMNNESYLRLQKKKEISREFLSRKNKWL